MSNTYDPVRPIRPARCPRCGYDQRGAVATWSDSCPLEGTCTECGLVFDWSEVLQPHKHRPEWCVEYAEKLATAPKVAIRTYLLSFRPWRFWKALTMATAICWRRQALYILLLLLPLLAGYVTLQTMAAVRTRMAMEKEAARVRASAAQWVNVVQWKLDNGEFSDFDEARMINLLEGLKTMQAMASVPAQVQHSYAAAIFEAIVFPWRGKSSGSVIYPAKPSPYPAPRSIHDGSRLEDKLIPAAKAGVGLAWLYLGLPLSFLLLPYSRRRAKVRWGHIWRITAYGFFMPATAATILAAAFILDEAVTDMPPYVLPSAQTLGIIAGVSLIIWWAMAIDRYLKIPHGAFTSVLLAVMCILGLLAFSFLVGFPIDVPWLFYRFLPALCFG